MTPRRKTGTALLVTILVLSAASTVAVGAEGAVNINTADAQELALLPRVGAVVAKRIIDFREENGEFRSIDDLMLVEGIGEKTFELMKPFVSLEGKTTLGEKVKASREKNPERGE